MASANNNATGNANVYQPSITAAPAPTPAPTAAPTPMSAPAPSPSPSPAPAPVDNFASEHPATPYTGQTGEQFVTYNGQQTLGMSNQHLQDLNDGVAQYNQATGGNLSAFDYDKLINPKSYGARWNADGTPNTDAVANVAPYVSGSMDFSTHAAATPAPASGGGTSSYKAWSVTPEQTVEQRIASIVNGGSPLIQQARAGAIDQMNARGLSDSSLATTASDAAAYQAAMPIAQQDAATFAKAAGYNSDIQNQMSMQGRQLDSQKDIANLQAQTSKDIATQQTDTQKAIAQLNSDTTKYTANLDSGTRLQVQTLQNGNSLAIATTQQGASIFNQAVAAISSIQGNDKMDAAAKTQAIAQVLTTANNELGVISKSTGTNVQLNLGKYPGFDPTGVYVGFKPDGTTNGYDANGNWVGLDSPTAATPAPAPATYEPSIVLTQ